MNFGKWIVVAFVFFAAFIAVLVTVCVRQSVPLVTKEYYQEELVYQDQIARVENTNNLLEKPLISIEDTEIVINYALLPEVREAELKLFRPSDAALDESFSIETGSSTTWKHAIKNPAPGLYRARLKWEQSGKEYFLEKVVVL